MTRVRIATRGSALARWQAGTIAAQLARSGVDVEQVIVETSGDRRVDVPLAAIGGQGVFVREVQLAVLQGRADCAVHSAKDLPSTTPPGLVIAAVPTRADPRDALVGRRLDELRAGAVVATGSARRAAQLALLRPDLRVVGLRGNIGTRLEKIPPDGAILMAVAALDRLALRDRVAEVLAVEQMVPQVGQGALAVECRAADSATLAQLAAVDDEPTHRRVDLERTYLAAFGGGCDVPLGAYCDEALVFTTFAAGPHGTWRDARPLDAASGVADAAAIGRAALESVSRP